MSYSGSGTAPAPSPLPDNPQPDEAVAGQTVHHLAYAAKTLQPVSAQQYEALTNMAAMEYDQQESPVGYAFVTTKA